MSHENEKHENHTTGYGLYIIVWLALLGLTSITVTIAGIDLGSYTLFVALTIAAVKSYLVISIFMHIKFDDPIFKVFILISVVTLAVIFLLTYFDIIYR